MVGPLKIGDGWGEVSIGWLGFWGWHLHSSDQAEAQFGHWGSLCSGNLQPQFWVGVGSVGGPKSRWPGVEPGLTSIQIESGLPQG